MSQAVRIDKKAVAGSFGRAAADYDRHASLQRQVADRLLDQLPGGLAAPAAILDIGSGTGYCTEKLAARFPGGAFCSLDLSPPMLRYARSRHPGRDVGYVCGDAERLPFNENAFDLLVSSLAIQWCADLPALFAELRRVARPGARCLLSTFGPDTLRELREAWAAVDAHVHVNRFSAVDEILTALKAQGIGGARLEDERRILHYPDFAALGAELKAIGARNRNPGQPPGLTGRRRLQQLRECFERDLVPGRGVPVTWQVLYLDFRIDE